MKELTTDKVELEEKVVNNVQARIKNANQVRLVADYDAAKNYYIDKMGFTVDDWGHTLRDGMGFILQQAEQASDIRPNPYPSRRKYPYNWPGSPIGWDTYAYSDFDGIDKLYQEFISRDAIIAYQPQIEDLGGEMQWKEFAIKDLDGYVIVFGGGKVTE